jgi:hypothetical protein
MHRHIVVWILFRVILYSGPKYSSTISTVQEYPLSNHSYVNKTRKLNIDTESCNP